ncbi:unnamed protein product [Closterium sp. NIES-53]
MMELAKWHISLTAGAGGAGASDHAEPGGAGARGTGAGGAGARGAGAGDTGVVGVGVGGTGAGGTGAGGTGAGDTGTVDPGAGGAGAGGAVSGGTGAGDTVRSRPFFVPLLQQVLGLPSSTSLTPPLLCPPPDLSQPPLQPASPLRAPSSYTEQTGAPTERREPESRPASPVRAVCTGRRVPRRRPPPVPGTHAMVLCPSSVPLRVPLPPPSGSSLPAVPDPQSDLARAASPTVSRLLATVVTDPSFESTAASALVAELSESASLPSVGGECALGTDVLEERQEDLEYIPTLRSYAEAITGPSSQWQAAMDAEMASWKSTGIYLDAIPPSRAKIVDGMWVFIVKRLPGSLPSFKARYVARALSQRQGVD